MDITIQPIATVRNQRKTPIDDNWSEVLSEIHLSPEVPTEALLRISDFSHLEILYYFDKAENKAPLFSRHPRGNPAYPLTGIFGQRNKDRPNGIGLCTVELVGHKDGVLIVKNLDAIDGTPVIDIKPVFREFQPVGDIRQPDWVSELMKNYWQSGK